jgi:SAM-dependent methyltransferase
MSPLAQRIVDGLRLSGFDRVSRVPLEHQAAEFLSEERAQEQIELLQRYVPDLAGKVLLEVGSGYGTFVAYCNRCMGCDAYGLEPGKDAYYGAYEISQNVLQSYGVSPDRIKQGSGEAIPFPAESFHAIFSSNVLEHTQDPARVLIEVFRVLKVGGRAVLVFPNYGSWWEGHYGVLFPPYCPKSLFKILVTSLGRDPSFVDTLQFITIRKLRRWLAKLDGGIRIVTFGQEIWEHRVRTAQFSEWAELRKLKTIVRWIHRLNLVGTVVSLGRLMHWETPFVLVFEKTAASAGTRAVTP